MSRILFDSFDSLVSFPASAGTAPSFVIEPPGAIGLVDREAVVLLRFNEVNDTDFPVDSAGGLNDLGLATGLAQPVVTSGAVGRARIFNAGTTTGYVATDRVAGTTLLTRDMSVQMIVGFNMANQIAYGTPGQIVKRGKGFGWGASEIESFAINSSHVGVAPGDCRLSWEWETVAGALKVQTGVVFTPPPPGKFTMITLTRRWISPTSVVNRYYAGDLLLGEETSADGDIGGSILGTTGIGSVGQGGGSGYGRTFALGIIDELMIVGRELCFEEIEATWLRITRYQPLGVQLFLEMHDPGFPISSDPASDVQLDTRMIGQALGYAAATAENLRKNFLPGRAYGTTLDQWEELTRATQQHADHNDDDLDARRARVLARLRQRRGISIPGLGDALAGLIGDATFDDLEFLAFSNTVTDPFATLDLLRWDVTPIGSWTSAAGGARAAPAAGTYAFTGTPLSGWLTMGTPVSNDFRANMIAKVAMTTPQANLECGVYFGNRAKKNYLLFGLRDTAGAFSLNTERFLNGVSIGGNTVALGGNPANLWLHAYNLVTDFTNQWVTEYSLTSGTSGFIAVDAVTAAMTPTECGMYVRSIGATAGAAQVNADDFVLRAPFGTAPDNAYVLLDQALGFSPDVLGAQSTIAAIKHAFTHATFITRRALLCDDAQSGCDRGPMGGY